MDAIQPVRLSQLSHGGGCGCKLAPSVLQQLLSSHPTMTPYERLLVGVETGDDAAVWELDDGTCIIATTDFFMPMVDDPHDFGRIAATNAIQTFTRWAVRRLWLWQYSACRLTKSDPRWCAKF